MLYIIPTPIGNLEDITIRAIKLLKKSKYIILENFYKSNILFNKYKIFKKKIIIYNKYNENKNKNIKYIINIIKNNKIVSLISNSGTPLISDPGFTIIKNLIKKNIKFITLPGPTAFIPALINSGYPIHNFLFIGFLPTKKKKIIKIFKIKKTIIFFDNPKRFKKNFKKYSFLKNKSIFINKEISKKFEKNIKFIYNKNQYYRIKNLKGELTVIVNNN
ncbi:MAG: SAM-dependent methyltransferase [Candidatus Shikimatogenerans sp. AspAUS03]|uniref:SAM-dependent methyltransferase n=1 Tax=Candidatus Shikimatogenerans sp. AspAUS03 TaxID=3158563 RepID=A0AAU7QT11_9FLAO